ncbi:hypothetical protein KM043_012165 [Ampulex compressa]|nr:hypothetical protein KM043_012165 [Ampulex compressa]
MQYHAMSYAKEGFTVDFIGYPGSLPLKEIRDDPHIKIHYLREPPTLTDKLPTIVHYAIKVLWQAVTLLWILIYKRISSYLILQNPPTVPTIPVCWFYCILTDTKFMIDWHNYGYSLLALSLKKEHVLVKLAKFIESFFGSMADKNFCVTRAMKEDLLEKWGIEAHVLYDRPADNFHSILLEEKHEFLLKLAQKYDEFKGEIEDATIFTEKSSDGVRLLPHRPGFIVSSTSWTEDEDFSILLNALQDYENEADTAETSLPNLICAITVITPWLENEEYPKILASADLGICLHTSSSGLDLPMKIVDMFGCGLPVCAYEFNCLSELVRHDENGLVFASDAELASQLKRWFRNFPNNEYQHGALVKFQQEINQFQENRWHGNWACAMLPCLS